MPYDFCFGIGVEHTENKKDSESIFLHLKMSKLEDLLGKKKEVVPILDLSKTILNSKEEYKRISEKVPDYKMRPIKVGKGIQFTKVFQ